jgi:hypothetical protein
MRTGKSNDRVFIAELDTVTQADVFGAWQTGTARYAAEFPPGTAAEIYLGRLRFESLLSERIVVSDAQALDGIVLGELVVTNKINGLARARETPLPLEIRCRGVDLQRSLWSMYVKPFEPATPRRAQVREFYPSLFRNGEELGTALGTLSSKRGRHPIRECLELLERAGADPADMAKAEEVWRGWVRLTKDKRISLRQWSSEKKFAELVAESEKFWTKEQLRSDRLFTPTGNDLFDEVLSLGTDRSPVYLAIGKRQAAVPRDSEEYSETQWINLWYDERYRRAQAFQHEADYRGSDAGLTPLDTYEALLDIPEDLLQAEPTTRRKLLVIHVPPGTMELLGRMPDADWWRFNDYSERDLHRWWAYGDTDALSRVIELLSEEVDSHIGRPSGTGTEAKTLGSGWGLDAAKVLFEIIKLPANFDAAGIGIAVTVTIMQSFVEALAAARAPRVQITDYFDDVPGAAL